MEATIRPVPVTTGMLIRAKRSEAADKIRSWSRRIAGIVFAIVVAILLLGNVKTGAAGATVAANLPGLNRPPR
jgi:bile acid:Na+ symporter, BASS family